MTARRRISPKCILFLSGSIILLSALAALPSGSNSVKIASCAGALLTLFALLIYFQLKFYRDGDRQHIRNRTNAPSTTALSSQQFLKSPRHRAIWENMEQTRMLMRRKEQESLRVRAVKEKQALGLPADEAILFMADGARFYCWPIALPSVILLFIASIPTGEFPASASFLCLISGLFGLLVLATDKFRTRYYLTSFRVLVRYKRPLHKTKWDSLGYSAISSVDSVRKFSGEELALKSSRGTISVRGLSRQKFQTVLGILQQRLY